MISPDSSTRFHDQTMIDTVPCQVVIDNLTYGCWYYRRDRCMTLRILFTFSASGERKALSNPSLIFGGYFERLCAAGFSGPQYCESKTSW